MAGRAGRDDVVVVREDLAHPLTRLAPSGRPEEVPGEVDVRVFYSLAAAPRTGSTLLSAALWSTGALGRPEECFRPGDQQRWAKEWGIDWPDPDGLDAYLRAMIRWSTTPNGVCAVKLFPSHLLALPEGFMPPRADGLGGADVRMVHLRRRDKVRAGISEWKAQVTGQWVLLPDESPVPPPRAPHPEEITRYHEFQHAWDRFWCGARAGGVPSMELEYEETIEDLDSAVEQVAEFLGVEDVDTSRIVRPRRQSRPVEDDWIRSWVDATGGCAECGHT